jgi:hypothetical protein
MAREAVLKEDLHVMRAAIDSYTMDKQKAPQSLDDLIQDGYLKAIPEDPMTHSKDTWVTDSSDALHSLDQTDPGIDDVHSGSQELARTVVQGLRHSQRWGLWRPMIAAERRFPKSCRSSPNRESSFSSSGNETRWNKCRTSFG